MGRERGAPVDKVELRLTGETRLWVVGMKERYKGG
jgi:hypothetical protein